MTPLNPETKDPYFMFTAVGIKEHIEVWMSNMSRVFGFGFYIQWNATDKKMDLQSLKIADDWPAPYEYYYANVTTVGDQSYLEVDVRRPSEKPAPTCKIYTKVAEFDLITKYDSWSTYYLIPFKENSTVSIYAAYQLTKKADGRIILYDGGLLGTGIFPWTTTPVWSTAFQYTLGFFSGTPNTPIVADKTYALKPSKVIIDNLFRPFSVENEHHETVGIDLNLDGAIDQQDLQALALQYGKNLGIAHGPSWGYLDNLLGPGVVDIFDFVLVAGKYGKTWVPDIAN